MFVSTLLLCYYAWCLLLVAAMSVLLVVFRPRLIILTFFVLLSACAALQGERKPSSPPATVKKESSYTFPPINTKPRVSSGTQTKPQSVPNEKTSTELLRVITQINRAEEKLDAGQIQEARELLSIPKATINLLPQAQQAQWYKLRSVLEHNQSNVGGILANEQQLLVSVPSHERVQHNTGLLARLLELNQTQRASAGGSQTSIGGSRNAFAEGWLDLVDVFTSLPADYAQQKIAWQNWQRKYKGHSAERYPPQQISWFFETPTYQPHYALLLPLSGPYAPFGKAIQTGFNLVANHPSNQSWMVQPFDVTNQAQLQTALLDIANKGTPAAVGPLDKTLAASAWGDSRIQNYVALNYLSASTPGGVTRAELGLRIEDEGEWVGSLLNNYPNMQVALLQQQASIPARASASLLQATNQPPEILTFGDNKSFVKQIEKALGVSARDIQRIKPLLTQHARKLNRASTRAERAALLASDPANRLRDKVRLTHLILFADNRYASQLKALLDFYYANNVRVITYSAAIDLTNLTNQASLDGTYVVDIPSINTPPSSWHEWVAQDIETDMQFYRFYALGVDSALLVHNIGRLSQAPGFRIRGATGRLGFDPKTKKIKRDLSLHVVKDGSLIQSSAEAFAATACLSGQSAGQRGCL